MPNFPLSANLGRHWNLVQVAPATEDEVAGTYTIGTYVSIFGTVIEHSEESMRELENISPATMLQRNPVQVEVGQRVAIVEYMTNAVNAVATVKQSKLRELDYTCSLIAYKFQGVAGGTTTTWIIRLSGGGSRRIKGGNTYNLTGETIAVVSGGNPTDA